MCIEHEIMKLYPYLISGLQGLLLSRLSNVRKVQDSFHIISNKSLTISELFQMINLSNSLKEKSETRTCDYGK